MKPSDQFEADNLIIPIPLRENLVVRISGIPHDLSYTEAGKLCNVIGALVEQKTQRFGEVVLAEPASYPYARRAGR